MDRIVVGVLQTVAILLQITRRSWRFGLLVAAAAGITLGAGGGAVARAADAPAPAPYARQASPLSTPWTDSVSTANPWPEYPRPQLERFRWVSLNGRWQYEQAAAGQAPPFGTNLSQTILVPFPVESPLSGIERQDQAGWYRRTFAVPARWGSDHVMLNFGAVAWRATVYVNGRLAGRHHGDYDAFSLDITHLLKRKGTNELVVGFYDPVGGAGEPVGKQALGPPSGLLHSAVSGIWQTVWLEPVPARHISGLELTPNLEDSSLNASVALAGPAPAHGPLTLRATALAGKHTVASAAARAGRRLKLHISHPVLWSPSNPYLYGLRVELLAGGRVLDSVSSYFGMRSISLGRMGGAVRILLNGHFVFQTGALDQGYWPDGLYTPPADGAIRFDIQAAKRLGYDMLREHAKVEPDRWYYWADRLGILVWQDMPSFSRLRRGTPSAASQVEFRRELARIVTQHRSDPSIVTWVPFNEGWGAFAVSEVGRQIRRLDPTSLIDTDSGSANCCDAAEPALSDMRDAHLYPGPFAPLGEGRASVIGEYGGVLPFPPPADRWPGVLTSVGHAAGSWPASATQALLRAQYAALAEEMRVRGLSASIFTELGAYEQELGIISYDRRAFTMSPALVHGLNQSLISASERPDELAPQPPRPMRGPTGSWSFSPARGTTGTDSSGHGNTLTLQNGAGWADGPRLRGHPTGALAITAPGQSAVSAQPVIDTQHSFTVSVWLKAAAPGESGTAVSEPGPDGSSFSLGIRTEPRLSREATWWTFVVPARPTCASDSCGVRANMHYDDGRSSPRPGRWYQLTAVYDTRTASIALFVDGISEDVEHVFSIPPAQGPLTVGEGSGNYGPPDTFTGAIGELRSWARALSPAEVWELYRFQSA